MVILKFHSRQFPNALHLQCATEIGDWAPQYPDLLAKTEPLFNICRQWLNREKTAYRYVIKSAITDAKEGKDRTRDDGFHGLLYTTLAATRHHDPVVVAAAKRLLLVLNNFNHKPIVKLSYDAETATINALLVELGKHTDDIAIVGLQSWVDGLKLANAEFEALAKKYHDEISEKPEYNMKNSRVGFESATRTMFGFIEALNLMEGDGKYAPAIQSLNAIIKHYNEVYAQHKGATATTAAGATTITAAGSEPATSEQ
jgi:hypothetical protein